MEYRYCPNMIVIDTPGMIHPPKGKKLTPQQRALAIASREAENLVLSKIRCQDYIILCVEDTTDWKHATTRNIVMQADPFLERTVLVTTKLDTKLPQFSEAQDLEEFLSAPLIRTLFAQMLGGPFYTTVPSGRVFSKSSSSGGVGSGGFDSNEAFVEALKNAEKVDRSNIFHKIGRSNAPNALKNVGISRLRGFLEKRIEESYRRNVNKIVPLLTNELSSIDNKLDVIEKELNSLSLERLQSNANIFREKFAKELSQIIQGTIRVSPEEWGETLEAERNKGGHYIQNLRRCWTITAGEMIIVVVGSGRIITRTVVIVVTMSRGRQLITRGKSTIFFRAIGMHGIHGCVELLLQLIVIIRGILATGRGHANSFLGFMS
jgi:hypothetical protein